MDMTILITSCFLDYSDWQMRQQEALPDNFNLLQYQITRFADLFIELVTIDRSFGISPFV